MLRTTITLDEKLYKKARIEAINRKISFGKVVNEALADHLGEKTQNKITGNEFLNRLTKYHLKGGPKDLAKNLDKYTWDNSDE
jgi:hypothetical protein